MTADEICALDIMNVDDDADIGYILEVDLGTFYMIHSLQSSLLCFLLLIDINISFFHSSLRLSERIARFTFRLSFGTRKNGRSTG